MKENRVEELYTLNAGRWGIVVSKIEPGTLEHQQGARHVVTIYCDEKLIVGYACTAMRRGEGACVEDMIDEGPDLVDFVLSERDLRGLELLLARAHQLVRDLSKSACAAAAARDGLGVRGKRDDVDTPRRRAE
jgi:hypothetical protein